MTPSRQRILIVTRHTPLPWDDGAGAYLHGIAAHLATRNFDVHILWLEPHEPIRWSKRWTLPPAFSNGVRLHLAGAYRVGRSYFFPAVVWQPFKARFLHRVGNLPLIRHWKARRRAGRQSAPTPPPVPPRWMKPPSEGEAAAVCTAVRKLRPHGVVVSYAWLCPLFDQPALRNLRKACLTHDIASHRAALALAIDTRLTQAEITSADESAWLQRADTLIAISQADADQLHTLAPAARLTVAPMAFAAPPVAQAGPKPRLLFVGSANVFNVDGLNWFLGAVWPRLHALAPELELDICGNLDAAVPGRPSGVTFHGRVAALAPFYRDAIVIVPLRSATGMNIKLAEAAAYGRPVVTTPAPLAGAPFLAGAVHTADTPEEFTTAVLHLYHDPAARHDSGNRARAAVEQHLAPEACYAGLLAALASPPGEF